MSKSIQCLNSFYNIPTNDPLALNTSNDKKQVSMMESSLPLVTPNS